MTFYHHRLDRESTVKARLLVRPLTVLTFSECCSTFAVKPWKVTKVFHIVQKSVTKNFIWDWHFCLTSLNWVIGLKCAIIDSWFQVIYRSLISSGFLYREIFHCDSFFLPPFDPYFWLFLANSGRIVSVTFEVDYSSLFLLSLFLKKFLFELLSSHFKFQNSIIRMESLLKVL